MQSHVAKNVRAELARRNKRQEDIADLLGFTRQAVSRRLLGHVEFRIAELQAIADFFEVPIATLIEDSQAASA